MFWKVKGNCRVFFVLTLDDTETLKWLPFALRIPSKLLWMFT